MPTRDRGARVLCPIHRPEQPSDAASVTNDASRPPMRRCQGNEVFNTALATDMAACAFGAYHQPAGDRKVPPPAPPASQLVAPLSCSFNLFVWRLYSKAEGPHASAVLRFGDWREQHGEPLSYSIAHLHAHLQNFLERYSLPPTMNWPESILHLQAYLDRWEETCRYIDRCDHNTVQFLQGTNTSISSLCSLSWLHATLYPRCDD